MAAKADSSTISQITQKEKELTGSDLPAKGGPTAQAQKHAGEVLTGNVISDITKGEKEVTGGERVKGGPTSTAQSIASQSNQTATSNNTTSSSGILDGPTISKITAAETEITGQVDPVKGGPTAQAQRHAGKAINTETLHDITEGEKQITDNERVRGGPTSTAQSELGKSRN